jgi:uncharacterized membrane protein
MKNNIIKNIPFIGLIFVLSIIIEKLLIPSWQPYITISAIVFIAILIFIANRFDPEYSKHKQTIDRIDKMTINAMFIAILTIMTFTNIGFIAFTPIVSATLLHIPVLFGALLFGWKAGLFYGLIFGLLSLLRAAIAPVTVFDPYFINPLVSVLPRVIFGLSTGLLFDFIRRLFFHNNVKDIIINKLTLLISSFLLTLLHSILVLTALGLFANEVWPILGLIMVYNALPEATLAAILVPVLAIATQHVAIIKRMQRKI